MGLVSIIIHNFNAVQVAPNSRQREKATPRNENAKKDEDDEDKDKNKKPDIVRTLRALVEHGEMTRGPGILTLPLQTSIP